MTRLSGPNAFSNPFSSGPTAAVQPETPADAPAVQIAGTPLAPVEAQPISPIASAPLATAPVATASSAPVTSSAGGWTAAGGTPVTLGANDSLVSISNRYGVPSQAILQANGLASASQVQPGARIVIPVYNAGGTQVASAPAPRAAKPSAAPAGAKPKFTFVQGAKPAVETPAEGAKQRVRPGMASTEKSAAPAAQTKAGAAPAVAQAKPATAVVQKPAEQTKVAAAPKAEPAPEPKSSAKEPEQTASVPQAAAVDFRWPVRGKVIGGFGSNGNDGINIAVPEGTPVKAAEDGQVTYAGSEVRGYGNLVLIKHDNGYVSAYAHNGEVSVKRGDKVKRGQVIAKSGQTGNVTSPQLHFEIRKGQTPVDPVPHLSGG